MYYRGNLITSHFHEKSYTKSDLFLLEDLTFDTLTIEDIKELDIYSVYYKNKLVYATTNYPYIKDRNSILQLYDSKSTIFIPDYIDPIINIYGKIKDIAYHWFLQTDDITKNKEVKNLLYNDLTFTRFTAIKDYIDIDNIKTFDNIDLTIKIDSMCNYLWHNIINKNCQIFYRQSSKLLLKTTILNLISADISWANKGFIQDKDINKNMLIKAMSFLTDFSEISVVKEHKIAYKYDKEVYVPFKF